MASAAAVASLFWRANLWIAAVSTLISNPFTYAPIYYFAYQLGAALLGKAKGDEAEYETPNGKVVKVLSDKSYRDATLIPWGELGVEYVLECTGVYLTIVLGVPQLRYFGLMFKEVLGNLGKKKEGEGAISSFAALSTAFYDMEAVTYDCGFRECLSGYDTHAI